MSILQAWDGSDNSAAIYIEANLSNLIKKHYDEMDQCRGATTIALDITIGSPITRCD